MVPSPIHAPLSPFMELHLSPLQCGPYNKPRWLRLYVDEACTSWVACAELTIFQLSNLHIIPSGASQASTTMAANPQGVLCGSPPCPDNLLLACQGRRSAGEEWWPSVGPALQGMFVCSHSTLKGLRFPPQFPDTHRPVSSTQPKGRKKFEEAGSAGTSQFSSVLFSLPHCWKSELYKTSSEHSTLFSANYTENFGPTRIHPTPPSRPSCPRPAQMFPFSASGCWSTELWPGPCKSENFPLPVRDQASRGQISKNIARAASNPDMRDPRPLAPVTATAKPGI